MYKVIAAMMMAITIAMPVSAANDKHGHHDKYGNHDKRGHVEVVEHSHRGSHHVDMKSCTIKVSHHTHHNGVVSKIEHIYGVMNTSWNPRTRMLTVYYDAHKTSAHHIKHSVAR